MTTIAVPRSLAEALGKATEPILLVDDEGNGLGSFAPATASGRAEDLTAKEIAELKRRAASSGPWYSTEEMLAYIRSREQPTPVMR